MWYFLGSHMFTLSYRWQQGKKNIRLDPMNLFAAEEGSKSVYCYIISKFFKNANPF